MVKAGLQLVVVALLVSLSAVSWGAEKDEKKVDAASLGFVAGQVLKAGRTPLANGTILLFDDALGPPPSREKYWRVPDIVESLDQSGRFEIGIPAGKYYLIAMERMAEQDFRPPEGDTIFYFHADPKGNPRFAVVTPRMLTDIGIIATSFPFNRAMVSTDKDVTAVEGVVVDAFGKPVEGALVLAFPVPSENPRPLFVSEKTDKTGRFILRTHDGGEYNLKVRGVYGGGPPETGEVVGSSGPSEMVPVKLKKGDHLKGVVLQSMRFPKRGQAAQ